MSLLIHGTPCWALPLSNFLMHRVSIMALLFQLSKYKIAANGISAGLISMCLIVTFLFSHDLFWTPLWLFCTCMVIKELMSYLRSALFGRVEGFPIEGNWCIIAKGRCPLLESLSGYNSRVELTRLGFYPSYQNTTQSFLHPPLPLHMHSLLWKQTWT